MPRPTIEEVRALDGERVRVTVPKPREDQRLVGVVEAGADETRLLVEAASEGHARVVLRARERDGVLHAVRGTGDGTLVGRVDAVEVLEE